MRTDQLGDPYRPRAAGEIDAPFLARYNRLVAVTKLITMQNTDKTSVPVFKAELERFVLDVLGEELKGEGKNPSYSIGSRFPLPVPVHSRPLFSPMRSPRRLDSLGEGPLSSVTWTRHAYIRGS